MGGSLVVKLSTLTRASEVRILAPQLFLRFMLFGGAKRDRTADLYNAIVALSQLSYSPLRQSYLFFFKKS